MADRLAAARKGSKKGSPAPPAAESAGRWNVTVEYAKGSAEHKVFLNTKANQVSGTHIGWAFEGELKGMIDGSNVEFRSSLPVGGQQLTYGFKGKLTGDRMEGTLDLGEYGHARWSAKRHA